MTVEKITEQEKNDFKELLTELSFNIKIIEKKEWKTTEVDEHLMDLSMKIENINTTEQANDFLNEIQLELSALKDYSEFKNILSSLEKKVDELKNKYAQYTKKELNNLQQTVLDKSKLTKEQIILKANIWRKKASSKIKNGIVAKLAQRNDWIWKIAQKANS
jgi:alpha-D-ribose 1-methylphosphonate 5-triphosphate diphosphatase PhnM